MNYFVKKKKTEKKSCLSVNIYDSYWLRNGLLLLSADEMDETDEVH